MPDLVLGKNPPPEGMPEIVGLHIGGCVKDNRRFRRRAHAHNHRQDPMHGWVCFLSPRRVYMDDGRPTRVLWHEYAHILTPNHGHDDAWRAKMRELGQPIPARYKPSPKPRPTTGVAMTVRQVKIDSAGAIVTVTPTDYCVKVTGMPADAELSADEAIALASALRAAASAT